MRKTKAELEKEIEKYKVALEKSCEIIDNASEGFLYKGEYIMDKEELVTAFLQYSKEMLNKN